MPVSTEHDLDHVG